MPVYKYYVTLKLGDGKKKKVERYKFDYKKVINGCQEHRKKQGFETRDAAIEAERQDLKELINPTEKKEDITINNLFNLFYSYKATKQKQSTMLNYHKYFAFISIFQNKPINSIKPSQINKWKLDLLDLNFSENYTNKIITFFRNMIEYAARKGYSFDKGILDELENIKKNELPPERIAWSKDEIKAFFDSFDLDNERDSLFYHYFLIFLNSTMRPNEFRCLMKKDIIGQYLSVNKSCTTKLTGKGLIIQPPKTLNSIRNVLMPDTDITWMQEHTKDYNDNEFIFGKETVIAETTLNRELKKHIELSGVRNIGLYNFRHTSITNLLLNGVPLLVVSKRAGHSSVSTTMNHYWHLFNGEDEKALGGIKWVVDKK